MKKKVIVVVLLIIVYVLGVLTHLILNNAKKKNLENSVIYSVVIDKEFINLRSDINLSKEPIKKVYKGERFEVVEYYEGNSFNWYKVIYEEDKTGWIASGKDVDWVIVENGCEEKEVK